MSRTVSLYDAKTHLSALVEEAAAGAEIVIAKNGRAKARLVPLAAQRKEPRILGQLEGRVWIAPDFDDPLPDDLLRLFYEGHEDDPLNAPPPR